MAVTCAMTQSVRGKTKDGQADPDGEVFNHFTDTAPQELRDLFLENFEVKDLDYAIFSRACDAVAETSLDDLADYEFEGEFASVYTFDRLQYLDNNNQSEISEFVQNYKVDIATACAIWYDEQVNRACGLIRDYILE